MTDRNDMTLNEGAFLYVLFTFQFLCVAIGFPLLLYTSCASGEKRANISRTRFLAKLMFLTFVLKWLVDTHELVLEQVNVESHETFDPYRLLHITADNSFNTKEIRDAYKRLARKYHPDAVNSEKVSEEKA